MSNKRTTLAALNLLAEVLSIHTIQYSNILVKLSKEDYIDIRNDIFYHSRNLSNEIRQGIDGTIKINIYTFTLHIAETTDQIITDFKYSIHSPTLIDDFISNLQESLLLDSNNYRNIQKFI